MPELIRVVDPSLISVPPSLQSVVNVELGDYFELTAIQDGVFVKKSPLFQNPPPTNPSIIDFLHTQHTNGRSKEDIDATLSNERSSWN